jgi:signal transduction histidine kinase
MLMGALLIHLTGGRIETHFHVFGSLAMLAFYRDWRVLIPATTIVAVDHMVRGLYWPESVYGVAVASEWRWVEHAAWVVFEDVFLVIACVRGTQELREIAVRTAILEQANRDSARNTIEQAELIARLRLTQQEVEAATRAKSEFVANMSHELRTPLNAVILYSELLQEGAVGDGRSDDAADLGKIQLASKHLLGLINGILDLSKIEAGKMELHLETFDVRTMTDELINTMGAVVRNNNNRLSVSYDNDPQTIHADLTKTRQILFNLLSNAAKFTSNGNVTVHVARRTVDGRECIEFAVRDDGIGLSEEQQQRLFRPFAQGDASISRKYGGTGLGLALVWRFCQLMGGEVAVQSALGQGATFSVRLPVTVVVPAVGAALVPTGAAA